MTDDDKRALELYRLALPLVEAKGRFVTIGVMTFKEYRSGKLAVVLMPKSGNLDIWYRRKVLTVCRKFVKLYTPGDWEKELEMVAGTPLKH